MSAEFLLIMAGASLIGLHFESAAIAIGISFISIALMHSIK